MLCLVAQSCQTLCGPMDCSPPGSSVHGISQARTLDWVAIYSSRASLWPRDGASVSCTDRWALPRCWTTSQEAQGMSFPLTWGKPGPQPIENATAHRTPGARKHSQGTAEGLRKERKAGRPCWPRSQQAAPRFLSLLDPEQRQGSRNREPRPPAPAPPT